MNQNKPFRFHNHNCNHYCNRKKKNKKNVPLLWQIFNENRKIMKKSKSCFITWLHWTLVMKLFHNLRKFTKISEKVVTCHKFLVMIMVMKFSKAPEWSHECSIDSTMEFLIGCRLKKPAENQYCPLWVEALARAKKCKSSVPSDVWLIANNSSSNGSNRRGCNPQVTLASPTHEQTRWCVPQAKLSRVPVGHQ